MSDEFIEIQSKWESQLAREKSRADRAEKKLGVLHRKLGRLYRYLEVSLEGAHLEDSVLHAMRELKDFRDEGLRKKPRPDDA